MVQSRAGNGNTIGVMVRMPEDLRDRVRMYAENEGRSMNSEIIAALEAAYPAPKSLVFELADQLVEQFGDEDWFSPENLIELVKVFRSLEGAKAPEEWQQNLKDAAIKRQEAEDAQEEAEFLDAYRTAKSMHRNKKKTPTTPTGD